MDPAQGGRPDMLEGDQEEVTFTDAQGVLHCSPHHNDWEGIDWYGDDVVNRDRSVVYRDVTRASPIPDVPWLLMESVSHEICRHSWIEQVGYIAVGMTIMLNVFVAGPISGASMNPARSLGPAIVKHVYKGLWVYIIGPIIGTIAGAFTYNLLRFTDKPLCA